MNKKLIRTTIILLFLMPTMVFAHYLGYSSVDNREIRYNNYSSYGTALSGAISTWNAPGHVYIAPDTWYTFADLNISDQYYPYERWAGVHTYYPWGVDTLILNSGKLSGYSAACRKNVALHEFGHALGLDHSYWGQIMYARVNCLTSLQYHDLSDYYTLWP